MSKSEVFILPSFYLLFFLHKLNVFNHIVALNGLLCSLTDASTVDGVDAPGFICRCIIYSWCFSAGQIV